MYIYIFIYKKEELLFFYKIFFISANIDRFDLIIQCHDLKSYVSYKKSILCVWMAIAHFSLLDIYL
jgi:hypothetical protein